MPAPVIKPGKPNTKETIKTEKPKPKKAKDNDKNTE